MDAEPTMCRGGVGFEDRKLIETTAFEFEDSESDQLAEAANLSEQQAAVALEWMRERQRDLAMRLASDILARLLQILIPPEGKISPRFVGMRLVAMVFLIGRTGESLTSLAERVGVSKQVLSAQVRRLETTLGDVFHGRQQKRKAAVGAYAEAQRRVWSRLSADERRTRSTRKKRQGETRNA